MTHSRRPNTLSIVDGLGLPPMELDRLDAYWHAYGAALDNPGLVVACVIGDGEAETGPLAAPIEVGGTREMLRRTVSDLGYPYLVLRLGIIDANLPQAPHTPRLPADQIIERTPSQP